MASIILSSVGQSIGNAILPQLGGRLLSSFARKAGRAIDARLGLSSSEAYEDGARLESFKVQDSSYGIALPIAFGAIRLAGNVIWSSDLIETAHDTTVGGKGGSISKSLGMTRTTYTYSLHCAVAICEGEIGGIQRIWADSKLIFENGVWVSGILGSASIHTGADDQAVDPLLESWIGAGETPAYRGVAYVVLESLQLKKFGNRLPNLTFEIMPKDTNGSPAWLGDFDPDMEIKISTNKQNAMPPLVLEGGAVSARVLLVGGTTSSGTDTKFVVSRLAVTGEKPELQRRDESAIFTCGGIGYHSWAMSKDERFIALCLQESVSPYTLSVCLFDTYTNTFGPVTTTTMLSSEMKQVAWIDAYHFVVSDYRSTARGVRVYMRSGLSVVDRGFYDVWGSGTSTTRLPIAATQFRPYGDGLLYYTGNVSLNFTGFYARAIAWTGNDLDVTDAVTVTSGYSFGSGSGPQVTMHQTAENEWTLFYLTVIDMHMMSFVPTPTGVTITRPWQKFTSSVMAVSSSNVPLVYGDRVHILHKSSTDTRHRLSEFLLADGSFTRITDAALVENNSAAASNFNAMPISSSRFVVLCNTSTGNDLGRVSIVKRRNTGDTLDRVVAALLQRAGYAASDYDLNALEGVSVDGYALTHQTTTQRALDPLRLLCPFDLIECDGQLKAVLHGQGDAVALSTAETAATSEEQEALSSFFERSRAQELALPKELTVDYMDASLDYETGSQRARKLLSEGARSSEKVTLPVVCTASKAKQIAESLLYALWHERDTFRLTLSRRWLMLSPGDVLTIEDARLRVASLSLNRGVVTVEAVAALPAMHGSAAEATASSSRAPSTLASGMMTYLYLMDVPLLRPQDNQPGMYIAASGQSGWLGATLWRSQDGTDFAQVAAFDAGAVSGVATTALAQASLYYKDNVSTVRVQLLSGTLASCTEDALLNGANVALMGAEIIQFQSATLIEPGLYELSGLLRGRSGTQDQTASHMIGEAFVLLTSTSVQFLPALLTDRNKLYHFRAVTYGGSLATAQDISCAAQLKTLRPYAPVHVSGERASGPGGDCVIRWKRCARMNAAWVDYIDVPLDEATEAYDVEVMNGATVVRTFAGVSAPQVTYTAAQQTADWGASVPSALEVRVYQISASYGRGAASLATV